MAFTQRKSLTTLKGSKWLKYAITRTGVILPNCFTYATARISELVGFNQPLDGTIKVRGAGNLWEQHHSNFKVSSLPSLGALMIWQGGAGNYGHVAICEGISDNGMVSWSQSNYGGAMFEFITGDPKQRYKSLGLTFKGYLYHKNMKKDVWNYVPKGAKKVKEAFEVTRASLKIYRAPTYNAKPTPYFYEKGNIVNVDYTFVNQGVLWVSWISKTDGTRRWMKGGRCNQYGALTKPYGNFK